MENQILLLTVTYEDYKECTNIIGKLIVPDISEATQIKAINKIHAYPDNDTTHLKNIKFIKKIDWDYGCYYVSGDRYDFDIEILKSI